MDQASSTRFFKCTTQTSAGISGPGETMLNYPIYFFDGHFYDGNLDYANTELEMIDVEISSSDEEVSLSEYDVVKIDEYQIQYKTNSDCPVESDEHSSNGTNAAAPEGVMPSNISFLEYKLSIGELDRTVAEMKPVLECVVCKGFCSSYTLLEQHFRLEHPNVHCHIRCCGLKFNNRSNIVQHLKSHREFSKPIPIKSKKAISVHTEELDALIQNFIPKMTCTLCGEVHSNLSELKKHYDARHSDKECHILCCNRKWTEHHAILEHLRVHLDPELFKCKYCEKFHLTKKSLYNHNPVQLPILLANSRDHDRPIIVGKTLSRKRYVDLDNFIMQWKSMLTCIICSVSCRTFTALQIHFSQEHPNEQCLVLCCERKFKTRNQLEEHINLHVDPLSYKCQLCNKWYVSCSELYGHMCTQHPLPLSEVDDESWDAAKQVMLTASRQNRTPPRGCKNIDELVAYCDIKVECGECGKLCPNYSLLKGHYYCYHPHKDCYLACCQLELSNQIAITNHLRTHVTRYNGTAKVKLKEEKLNSKIHHYDNIVARWKPNLECLQCHKTYPKFTLLKQHFLKDHPLVECYVICCQKKISGLQLVEHSIYHIDPKAFQCKHCGKCPSSKLALGEHMRVEHTRVKKHIPPVKSRKYLKESSRPKKQARRNKKKS